MSSTRFYPARSRPGFLHGMGLRGNGNTGTVPATGSPAICRSADPVGGIPRAEFFRRCLNSRPGDIRHRGGHDRPVLDERVRPGNATFHWNAVAICDRIANGRRMRSQIVTTSVRPFRLIHFQGAGMDLQRAGVPPLGGFFQPAKAGTPAGPVPVSTASPFLHSISIASGSWVRTRPAEG